MMKAKLPGAMLRDGPQNWDYQDVNAADWLNSTHCGASRMHVFPGVTTFLPPLLLKLDSAAVTCNLQRN